MENGGGNMRDFPFFTSDIGVASLVLREIPYKKEAYISVRDVQPGMLPDLLAECISFCKTLMLLGRSYTYQ
jgi:hypothetical protein